MKRVREAAKRNNDLQARPMDQETGEERRGEERRGEERGRRVTATITRISGPQTVMCVGECVCVCVCTGKGSCLCSALLVHVARPLRLVNPSCAAVCASSLAQQLLPLHSALPLLLFLPLYLRSSSLDRNHRHCSLMRDVL